MINKTKWNRKLTSKLFASIRESVCVNDERWQDEAEEKKFA